MFEQLEDFGKATALEQGLGFGEQGLRLGSYIWLLGLLRVECRRAWQLSGSCDCFGDGAGIVTLYEKVLGISTHQKRNYIAFI